MRELVIIAAGLVPLGFIIGWEAARHQRQRRQGFVSPVSTEGIRWSQYTGAAYTLGFAALALAAIDAHTDGTGLWLRLVVFSIGVANGLLLWNLGFRYGNAAPRLSDMRLQCYAAKVQLWQRSRQLAWLNHFASGQFSPELADSRELLARCDVQLSELQRALATGEFLNRLRQPETARAQLAHLQTEQAALLRLAARFLEPLPVLTMPAAVAPVAVSVR